MVLKFYLFLSNDNSFDFQLNVFMNVLSIHDLVFITNVFIKT